MNRLCQAIVSSLILCTSSLFADIERVSISSSGEQSITRVWTHIDLSDDGEIVTFDMADSNLVSNDSNAKNDIFTHDLDTGNTLRISNSNNGFAQTRSPSISANGRFVAYITDGGSVSDNAEVYDRDTGMSETVSISSSGEPQNSGHNRSGVSFVSMSADGRYVAFDSDSSNLDSGDDNAASDVFVRDREAGTTERVSVTPDGSGGTCGLVSANGRFVVFKSRASLVVEDTNNLLDIYIHDRVTKITERASIDPGNRFHSTYSISADGRYLSFSSHASNLVANDTNDRADIFVLDRETGITERVSVSTSGEQGNTQSFRNSISADGRFVVIDSFASNLVNGDTNNRDDIFVHDRIKKITKLISVSPTGDLGNGSSNTPIISGNGKKVAFLSFASNIVRGDTNNVWDAFVADNPLAEVSSEITIVKKINNAIRGTSGLAAQLSTGTLYRQSYMVTNNSQTRIYQVQAFEGSNLVCNFYALNPGETRERCVTYPTVIEGNQHFQVRVTAKVSGSGEVLTSDSDSYYTGLTNVKGNLHVTHRINNFNSDVVDQASVLDSKQATVLFKIENTGDIELYQVKAYHDPVSPENTGWDLQCVIGPMKPGQVRYCKRDIMLIETGLNQAMGRVQARNAIRSATDVVNASNPTYFIVP